MAKAWVKIANLKGPKGDVGTWFQRNLTASDNLDTLLSPVGTYGVLSGATATALALPFDTAGNVVIYPDGISVIQEARALAPRSENWQREMYANGVVWGEWRRTDFRKEQPEGLRTASPAAMKTAPQAVTLGHGGAQVTGSGYARGLIRLASSVSRVRVNIANRNPRYGFADDAAVALPAVTIGVHDGSGAQSSVTTIATGATTGTTGYTSQWVDAAAYAGKDILIGYDYNSAGTIQSNIGTGYGATGTTGAAGTGTATKLQAMPLFVWVEVEVPASTPVIAAYGDSLSAGVASSNVVYDSPVSQYARAIDGVPVHFAASGDSMLSWDAAAKKWSMYGDLPALADAVIFGMGSNDVFGGNSLADLQARHATVMASIRHRISPNVYGATIMPRTGVTGAMETTRREYNTWLKTRPELRNVFDFAASISTDDEAITPAYNADGTHLTTSGYAQNAGTLASVVAGLASAAELDAVDDRLAVVESMAGLAPGELSDATAAGLINNPPTDTRAAVDAAIRAITDPLNAGKLSKAEAATTYAGIHSAPVSVKSFGAIGDGLSDDTPFLQAAIDSGRALYWGDQTCVYKTTAQLFRTATKRVHWVSHGATIKCEASATIAKVVYFELAGNHITIDGRLTIDANRRAFTGISAVNNSTTLVDLRFVDLSVKNTYRDSQVFTGGDGIHIRGGFRTIHLDRPVVANICMAVGAGVPGAQGVTGINITAIGADKAPQKVSIVAPFIDGVYSEDTASNVDQDGVKVFASDDTAGLLNPFESSFNLIGGSIRNCGGRALKSQMEWGSVEGLKIFRNSVRAAGGPEIDFQVGGGTVRDVEAHYDGAVPSCVINFSGPAMAGKLVPNGSVTNLKTVITPGTTPPPSMITFNQRSAVKSTVTVRDIQCIGVQFPHILRMNGVSGGVHHAILADVFAAPTTCLVSGAFGSTAGWTGDLILSNCVNTSTTTVPKFISSSGALAAPTVASTNVIRFT